MLVPHMSMEEIAREVRRDFPILKRKMLYHIEEILRKLHKHQLKPGCDLYFDYRSKYKNQWIYHITPYKKNCEFTAMLIYHNGRGHVGIEVGDDGTIIYHTGHFFLRYNERLNLGLCAFNDIVKVYMKENFTFQFTILERISPDIQTFFGRTESGILLGTVHKRLHFARINTFLPAASLSPNQQEHLAKLRAEMEKYKDTDYSLP